MEEPLYYITFLLNVYLSGIAIYHLLIWFVLSLTVPYITPHHTVLRFQFVLESI